MSRQISQTLGTTHTVHFARLLMSARSAVKREPGSHNHSVRYERSRTDIVNHPEPAKVE